jgi:hypothetical protein
VRTLGFLLASLLFCNSSAHSALGAFLASTYADYKFGVILTATVDDFRPQTDEKKIAETKAKFVVRLKIHEVLRGDPPGDNMFVSVPWGHGSKAVVGSKVLAVMGKYEIGWRIEFMPRLEHFDDSVVVRFRNIVSLWATEDGPSRLGLLKEGLRDSDPQYRLFCIRAVADVFGGGYSGVDVKGIISRDDAFALLWQTFVDPQSPLECVQEAGNFLKTYCPERLERRAADRHHALVAAIRRHLASKREIHHNTFDYAVIQMSLFSDYARENYEVLNEILDGSVQIYKSGTAIRFGLIYQPNPTDLKTEKLNKEVWTQLMKMLTHENSGIAAGAAHAFGTIATNYAQKGSVPDYVMEILRAENVEGISDDVRFRLNLELKKVQPNTK